MLPKQSVYTDSSPGASKLLKQIRNRSLCTPISLMQTINRHALALNHVAFWNFGNYLYNRMSHNGQKLHKKVVKQDRKGGINNLWPENLKTGGMNC